MTKQIARKGLSRRTRLIVAGVVMALGVGLIAFFGTRAWQSWNRFQYMRAEGLDTGTASVDAIRPWMTIRFVAVAYAVPEEYLHSALDIPFVERKSDTTLGELNRIFDRGFAEDGQELAVVATIRATIEAYRAYPVVTGLRDVRAWMSVRYIANSTGVPEDYLVSGLGLEGDLSAAMPLDLLAEREQIEGGPRALEAKVRTLLDAYTPTINP
ncbi:MAG: hypothetical protein JNL73_02755 [Anaerolineales bacterium]|nr:hypothetical protein [Anaerolineales bacterium]